MDIFLKRKSKTFRYEECIWIKDLLLDGVSIADVLSLIMNSYNEEMILEIIDELKNGNPIGRYFFVSQDDQVMFNFFQSLYSFPQALEHCISIIDTKKKISKQLVNKLLYPLIIIVISSLSMMFVCFIVMPHITKLLQGMGMHINNGLYMLCIFLCLVLFLFIVFFALFVCILIWSVSSHKLLILYNKNRIIKVLFQFFFTYLFVTYFNTLMKQKISTYDALSLLSGIEDGVINEIAAVCITEMNDGKELVDALTNSGYIGDNYLAILRLGEVSNNILKYSVNFESLCLMKIENVIKCIIYVTQIISYMCVGLCAIMIMQLLMSPLELFELL